MLMRHSRSIALLLAATLSSAAFAQSLTVYSGRGEALVAPLVERFTAETGIAVAVRYGGTAELAVLILEEGRASPADVYWGQDAGALGALSRAGRLRPLPEPTLMADLPGIYTSRSGLWIATSGRARVLAYSPVRTAGEAAGLRVRPHRPAYRGRVGWAPTNGSFQAFVTAMRVVHGEAATEQWLRGMIANDVRAYREQHQPGGGHRRGRDRLRAHQQLLPAALPRQRPRYPVAQGFFADGDIGNLVNVAGAGIVDTSRNVAEAAERFLAFLLSEASQAYFTDEVFEYPVVPASSRTRRSCASTPSSRPAPTSTSTCSRTSTAPSTCCGRSGSSDLRGVWALRASGASPGSC
jgi:iron(III) transport system substrate-binding protein